MTESFKDPFSSEITNKSKERMKTVIASLTDALKIFMDEDKVVTPIDNNTLEETTGFDGMKSKESALSFIVSVINFFLINIIKSFNAGMCALVWRILDNGLFILKRVIDSFKSFITLKQPLPHKRGHQNTHD